MKKTATLFNRFFTGLTHLQALLVILFIMGVFGVIDYLTGFEFTFSFFYLFPVAIAVWYVSVRSGYIIAVCSIGIWLFSNWLAGETYSNGVIYFWNAAVRLAFFILICLVLSYLKAALELATSLSRTDSLTKALNAREFYRQSELELLRTTRYQHPITIAYLDLDNFKKVNDQFGHHIGDSLLRLVADIIQNNLRRTDIFARMGGDEFAILLPDTNQPAAEAVANKIKSNLQKAMQDKAFPVTFSLGAISFDKPPASIDEILRQADMLMYTVKTHGKNNYMVKNG